jgi:alpha-D-ribose 1-methylphosphonate 5-triphosphate synthase subunit PhnH
MMLAPAFDDPPLASQAVFRTVMEAMARPALPRPLSVKLSPPPPLSVAAAAVALTLIDYETPFWLDPVLTADGAVAAWLSFHTGAPLAANAAAASFVFIGDPGAMPPFDAFAPGSPEYPDRAATLVLQVENFSDGEPLTFTGPGIPGSRRLAAAPLPADFRARLLANRAMFPRGVDLVLVSGATVAALPRSIRLAGS